MTIDDSHGYELFDRLAEEFADRFRRGERPALKEYTNRYPELADEIRELFPALVKVEQVEEICQDRCEAEPAVSAVPPLSEIGDYRIIREVGHGGMGVVYEAEQVSLGRRVALKVLPWQAAKSRTSLERFRREARASARLHHTNIVPVFEVGEDGEVQYYAMQFIQGQSLDAVIHELRRLRGRSVRLGGSAGVHDDDRQSDSDARGLAGGLVVAKSLLTGRFDRPPTLAPSDGSSPVGPDGAAASQPDALQATDPSAVMPGGEQLSSVESRRRAFHRGVAHIGRQVALALAHAHARGILHRDIKPSNLLLDTEGVVWVSDFGLAKVDGDELTRTGDILGTLRYMAPERFRGRADARADVYALGLTLYELLTLRPAFDSPDRLALSEQIKTAEPPRPRSIDTRVPRDLETIVLKAIEKDPSDRYATAEAMAEDLRRFLDDESILARRASAPERYARWARRNPLVAALGGVLTVVLLLATIASVLGARRMAALAKRNADAARSERDNRLDAVAARARAEAERGEADRQRQRAEQHLYIARIGQAEGALRLYDAATARGLLDQCRPEPGEPDRRGWEWSYLDQWCRPELRTIPLPTAAQSRCLAASPDGRLLAVTSFDPDAINRRELSPVTVYLISLPDGRVQHELVGHNLFVDAVAFRPDGSCLATIGQEGRIRLWDTGSGRPIRTISSGPRSGDGKERGLSWSPDGRWIASADADGLVRLWDAETGRETALIAERARSVAWSPDGSRIALSLAHHLGLEVRQWDAEARRLHEATVRQPGWLEALCWSPDGRRLAATWSSSGSRSPLCRLTVHDATNGERLIQVGLPAAMGAIAFSPDGTRVATGGEEDVVRVFDAADGRQQAALFTAATQITGLSFSPDGRQLYAAGWGMGGVKVLDPARDPRGRRFPGWPAQSSALTFDRDGLRILGVCWHDRGRLAAADLVDGTVRTDRILPVTESRHWPRGDFAFSRDGGWLAAPTRRDPTVVGVWDVALGQSVARLGGSRGPVTAVAFSPDGRSIGSAVLDRAKGWSIVTIWHLASRRAIRTFEARPQPVQALAFSDDGRKLAAGGGTRSDESGWVMAWDAETGAVLGALDRVGMVQSLAFHPDGSRIAIADYRADNIHLWDLAADTLITHPGPAAVSSVGFTPDGKRLAALGYDGNVHLADSRTGEEVLVLRTAGPPAGGGGYTPRIAFSPDGSRIAANALDASLNLWDLGPAADLAVEPGAVDVGGWLRRGRALAERGDAESAEAAWARARALPGGDASPWIGHAAWLYRRGESSWARDALARAMEALPEDPAQWADLGQSLGRLGRTEESAMVLARARSLCERRLAGAPDDEATAAALAELLPEGDASAGWTVLRPDVMTSSAGATLTRLADGSILASGPNPPVDIDTIEATSGRSAITGLRLEALTDPSLPARGPGRYPHPPQAGLFHLTSIRLSTSAGPSAPVPVAFTEARANYSERTFSIRGVAGAIQADPNRRWSIWPLLGQAHQAVFRTARPIGPSPDMRLRVEIVSGLESSSFVTLGRFRLSVTDRPFPFFPPSLQRIRADADRSGLARLGAAYILLGDWAPAAAVLARATARPDATALDGLLLAVARHHLGRRDEARSDCDRALGRLAIGLIDEAAHDVAVEALMTIRGLSVESAETLLLDLAFPADVFAG